MYIMKKMIKQLLYCFPQDVPFFHIVDIGDCFGRQRFSKHKMTNSSCFEKPKIILEDNFRAQIHKIKMLRMTSEKHEGVILQHFETR